MARGRDDRARASFARAVDRVAVGPALGAYDDEVDSVARAAAVAWPPDRLAGVVVTAFGHVLTRAMRDLVLEAVWNLSEHAAAEFGRRSAEIDSHGARRLAEAVSARLTPRIATATAALAPRLSSAIFAAQAGDPDGGYRAALAGGFASARWLFARVAETEAAGTYNEARASAMAAMRREPAFRGLMMRWTERIDDDGNPLDERVAVDSVAMHAQLAPPGGEFRMPPEAAEMGVHRSLLGRSWPCPPNRPNDRAVLTPWMPGSGQGGWVLGRDGRRDLR